MAKKKLGKEARTAVIRLPETQLLSMAKTAARPMEELVKHILGGQAGRGIDQVIIKGGPSVGPSGVSVEWLKTVWKRAC